MKVKVCAVIHVEYDICSTGTAAAVNRTEARELKNDDNVDIKGNKNWIFQQKSKLNK
jgi:hypothetical protein